MTSFIWKIVSAASESVTLFVNHPILSIPSMKFMGNTSYTRPKCMQNTVHGIVHESQESNNSYENRSHLNMCFSSSSSLSRLEPNSWVSQA